jgi:sulfate adenylyltransferase subunit 2
MSSEIETNLEQWNARRRRAVELRVAGKSLPDIRRETGLSAPTVIAAHKAYLQGGWNAVPLEGRGRKRGVGRVLNAAQEHAVHEALRQAPETVGLAAGAWTLSNTAQWVHERFGIVMEERTLARYIGRWGFALAPWRKVADASEVARRWWATGLPDLVKAARARGAQVAWCCASPLPSGGGTLLRVQTLKGRIAWCTLPPAADDAKAIWHTLAKLPQVLDASLCVALSAPQLPASQ